MTATLLDRPTPATGSGTAAPATLALTVHLREQAPHAGSAAARTPARRAPRTAEPFLSSLGASSPPAPTTRPAAAPAARLRLTRRGRALRSLLVLAVGLLVVTAALVRGGAPAVGSDGAVPVQPQTVVQPGESLWSIAQRVAPGADPRSTVLQLKELNGLTSSDVAAGQPLLLPIER